MAWLLLARSLMATITEGIWLLQLPVAASTELANPNASIRSAALEQRALRVTVDHFTTWINVCRRIVLSDLVCRTMGDTLSWGPSARQQQQLYLQVMLGGIAQIVEQPLPRQVGLVQRQQTRWPASLAHLAQRAVHARKGFGIAVDP